MGDDKIHPRGQKELADVGVSPLTAIHQWSWEPRAVPVNWKLANVVPVFKKGKNENPGNYRPVSLTSVPGEIMEKIIPGVIEKHLRVWTKPRLMKGQPGLTLLEYPFITKLPSQCAEGGSGCGLGEFKQSS